jgi:hypothetical protein
MARHDMSGMDNKPCEFLLSVYCCTTPLLKVPLAYIQQSKMSLSELSSATTKRLSLPTFMLTERLHTKTGVQGSTTEGEA